MWWTKCKKVLQWIHPWNSTRCNVVKTLHRVVMKSWFLTLRDIFWWWCMVVMHKYLNKVNKRHFSMDFPTKLLQMKWLAAGWQGGDGDGDGDAEIFWQYGKNALFNGFIHVVQWNKKAFLAKNRSDYDQMIAMIMANQRKKQLLKSAHRLIFY